MKNNNLIILAVSMVIGISNCYTTPQEKSATPRRTTAKAVEAWLGVSVRDMTSSHARSLDAATEQGAFINEIFEDSPAERAGIREEDIIVRFDEQEIDGADDLVQAVRRSSPGKTYSIEIVRGDDRRTVQAELEGKPRRVRMHTFRMPHIPGFPGASLSGMHVMTLSDQLAEYFSIPDRRGVLVTEVEEKSPADKAGIKAGDVITQADGEQVDDITDLDNALSCKDKGENVALTVFRKGAARSVTLSVGKRRGYFFHFGPNSFFFDHDDN
ncbi:MAG: PDZ domain-containing protein, partial [Ignavibacteria bacterium]|nr:PDZ domain-containing protein [Ignavibacteria bacterium]